MSSGHDDSTEEGSHKVFQFTIVGGKVTEVFEVKDGVSEPKSIDDDGSETL